VSFKKGRAYARNLGLKTQKEWVQHCKSGKKPKNIPADPKGGYGNDWAGYGDWLGTGTIAPHLRKYLSFKKARAYVRSLNIKDQAGWKRYARSGKKPVNIPAAPWWVYEKEWIGMFDWLGSGQHRGHMKPFLQARAWARRQGLKSKT